MSVLKSFSWPKFQIMLNYFFVNATIQKVLQIQSSSLLHLKDKSDFFKKNLGQRPSTKLIGHDIE